MLDIAMSIGLGEGDVADVRFQMAGDLQRRQIGMTRGEIGDALGGRRPVPVLRSLVLRSLPRIDCPKRHPAAPPSHFSQNLTYDETGARHGKVTEL